MDKNRQGKSKISTEEYWEAIIKEAIIDCYDDGMMADGKILRLNVSRETGRFLLNGTGR